MINIVIEPGKLHGFVATLRGQTRYVGYGRTVNEAIGDLMSSLSTIKEFEVTIEKPNREVLWWLHY